MSSAEREELRQVVEEPAGLSNWVAELRRWSESASEPVKAATSLVMVGVVALLDIVSGTQLAFSLFYLAPVVLAAWSGSRATIVLVVVAAGASFPLTEVAMGITYRSEWVPYWNFAVRSGTYLVVGLLANDLGKTLRREQENSRTDSLTALSNSRAFEDATSVEIARARRSRQPLTLAYLDVDGFKSVNDDFGHSAGDELLRAIAAILEAETRPTDVVARLGGDEFAILLAETAEEGARVALERVRAEVRGLAIKNGYDISVSIGAATFDRPPQTMDELIWPADQLMYIAKRSGKDQIRQRSISVEDPTPAN